VASSNYSSSSAATTLIEYVIDVKPYHVKLSNIIEEYLFEENINIRVLENYITTVFLGADLVEPTLDLGNRPQATSWQRTFRSSGILRTFQLPLVVHPRFLSHAGQERFVAGAAESTQIPGLVLGSPQSPHTGAYHPRRWDGPGITRVTQNGAPLQEGWNYHISHGAYTFNTRAPGSTAWLESELSGIPNFAVNDGALSYAEVHSPRGTVTNIIGNAAAANYEEWTLECTHVGPLTATLRVTGSSSGQLAAVATFNVPYSSTELGPDLNPLISFNFIEAVGDVPGTVPPISVGDRIILTPRAKITVHVSAPEETWSLIKVNTACLTSAVTFTPGGPNAPTLSVYARDLHNTPSAIGS